MSEIYYYHAEIADKTGMLGAKKEFECEKLNIIAENHDFICLNDYGFTTVAKEKSEVRDVLDKPSICLFFNDRIWGNRITYRLYASKPKKAREIRAEIEKKIHKKIGFYIEGINLSFINEDALKDGAA